MMCISLRSRYVIEEFSFNAFPIASAPRDSMQFSVNKKQVKKGNSKLH